MSQGGRSLVRIPMSLESLGSKARTVLKAVLTAMCEHTVEAMWDPHVSQPYKPPRPVTGTALVYYLTFAAT
jgi:hypothetical protein